MSHSSTSEFGPNLASLAFSGLAQPPFLVVVEVVAEDRATEAVARREGSGGRWAMGRLPADSTVFQ